MKPLHTQTSHVPEKETDAAEESMEVQWSSSTDVAKVASTNATWHVEDGDGSRDARGRLLVGRWSIASDLGGERRWSRDLSCPRDLPLSIDVTVEGDTGTMRQGQGVKDTGRERDTYDTSWVSIHRSKRNARSQS